MLQALGKLSTLVAFAVAIPTIIIIASIAILFYHWSRDGINPGQSVRMVLQDYSVALRCTGSLLNFIARSDLNFQYDKPILQSPIGRDLVCRIYADTSHPTVRYRLESAKRLYDSLNADEQAAITQWLKRYSATSSLHRFLKEEFDAIDQANAKQ